SGIVIIRYPMASFATPVVISDWNAQCVENETVLHWTTTSEKNAAYFIIEKSLDAVQWYYLATMKAQGNSSVEQHYSYHDKKSQSGPRYYRLKQTDLDEQSVYSNVVHATCDGANDANIQIVPNPTQGLFHILNTNARSGTRISVYQSTGLKMATVNGGEKNVVIDLHKEPKGLYFIEIIQDQERYWKKVLLE
ncbi:MAG TPA: T9SS type A sorting domain-containing protein, partial [Chitinophagaceae bacterium]|nr:T9SS type A sorting domain-containing protein [Chitinophagaceae bacterium]